MLITHLGCGICSYSSRITGAIFQLSLPGTIIRSAWRGLARNTSLPNRLWSNREALEAIISIAQQASPNAIGHRLLVCAIRSIQSSLVIRIELSPGLQLSIYGRRSELD